MGVNLCLRSAYQPQPSAMTYILAETFLTDSSRIRKLMAPKPVRAFVVTSPEIWALWETAFLASFPTDAHPSVLLLPAGESHKRLSSVESLAQQLAMAGAGIVTSF